MNIIKEYCKLANKCVIRTNTYARTWNHFNMLVDLAKKDFPLLNDEDIEIVQYKGISYARTFGIEFRVNEEPKDDYFRITQLEYTG